MTRPSEGKQSELNLLYADHLSNPILVVDQNGLICQFNKAFSQKMKGWDLTVCQSTHLTQLIPELAEKLSFPLSTFSSPIQVEKDIKGTCVTFHVQPFVSSDKHVVILNSEAEENMLQLVLDSIPARVFWKGVNGRYLGCNQLFASDCDLNSPEDIIGLKDHDLFEDVEADTFVNDDDQVIKTGIPKLNIELPITLNQKETSWLQISKVPIRNNSGSVIGIMGSYTDISDRKRYQQLIEHQARFDQLTGLPNRLALQEKLRSIDIDDGIGGGLIFIDLDEFKTINDSLGHVIGDTLLRKVSKRIVKAVKNKGFVVRLGGDEFSILVIDDQNRTHKAMANHLREVALLVRDAIIKPFSVEDHKAELGVSIGITQASTINSSWLDKLNEADIAMYEAKAVGQNSIRFFTDEMRFHVDYIHRMQSGLNGACENNELYLMIQPQFDEYSCLIGGEGLLRWQNTELGLVPPSEFIPISEKTGKIHNIGMWVFHRAFSLIHRWSSQMGTQSFPPLAVNISPKQFQKQDFVKDIEKLLQEFPINPNLLEFELTESLLLENQESALDKLNALRDLGFSLSIDDFGTGYSCLSYVSKLPINKLKIDQSFTHQITQGKRQATIVETIIAMARNLGMGVIAEGVETEEQLEFLIKQDCHQFQGYYFSRPLPEADYQHLLMTQPNYIQSPNRITPLAVTPPSNSKKH